MEIKILYGSETGNSQSLANDAKKKLDAYGFQAEVVDMQDVSLEKLSDYRDVLIITSTWGDGEPPANAENLYNDLQKVQTLDLSHMRYAVFALGQSFYEHFCKVGKDFDTLLEKFGAKRIAPVELSDDDHEEKFPKWLENIRNTLLTKV